MPPGKVIRAVDHPYRRNILHILARGPLTYSQLFASMEPRGGGRGRFNYHLKVLREAGLIRSKDNHYGLSETGEAAVSFLEGMNRNSNPRGRLSIPPPHVGPLIPFVIVGLASALLLWSILAPTGVVPPSQPLEAGWGVAYSLDTGEKYTRLDSRVLIREDVGSLRAVIDDSGNALAKWSQTETTHAAGGISETRLLLYTARFVPGSGWGEVSYKEAPREAHDAPWDGESNRRVLVDGMGNAFALWATRLPSGWYEVYGSRSIASGGWATPTLLDQGMAGRVDVGKIVTNSAGRAIATWTVAAERYELFASSYTERGWASPVRLGPSLPGYTGGLARSVSIVINPMGDAVAIWKESQVKFESYESRIWARVLEAGTGWRAPVPLGTTSGHFTVARNANGDAVAIWTDLVKETELWSSVFEARSGWRTPVFLGTWGTSDERLEALASLIETIGGGWPTLYFGGHLSIDDRGNAVYVQGPDGWNHEVEPILWSRYIRGTGWTAPDLLDPSAGVIYRFEGRGDGSVVLLWHSGQSLGYFASYYTPESSWTIHELVGMSSAAPRRSPELAIGPRGNAFVVWLESSTPVIEGEQQSIWATYFVRPLTLDDLVRDLGYDLDLANSRLAGFELRFLLLAGVIVGLLASYAIYLSIFWYHRRGLVSPTESPEEPEGPPREGG